MFERFTDRARRVLVMADGEARLLGGDAIGTEHLLLAMVHEGDGVAGQALASLGVSLGAARAIVAPDPPASPAQRTEAQATLPFTRRSKTVLELALREALQLGHNYIGTEHLLLGLVRDGTGEGVAVLTQLGVDPADVRPRVIDLLSGAPPPTHGVVGALVEPAEAPADPATLFSSDDAAAVLAGMLPAVRSQTSTIEFDGVTYAAVTHHPRDRPEISVAVARARVSREAFDQSTTQMHDAEPVAGLGDAATWSPFRRALRVLAGHTVLVVTVHGSGDNRDTALAVARTALHHLPPPSLE